MSAIKDDDIQHWNETTFNHHVREAMLQQGLRVLHVREANEVGVSDLIVSEYVGKANNRVQNLLAWLELKLGWSPGSVRPAQRDFMRQQWKEGKNAWFAALMRPESGAMWIDMYNGVQTYLDLPLLVLPANPYNVDWLVTFERLKILETERALALA